MHAKPSHATSMVEDKGKDTESGEKILEGSRLSGNSVLFYTSEITILSYSFDSHISIVVMTTKNMSSACAFFFF